LDDLPNFDKNGICYLQGEKSEKVVLHKALWEKKIARPERGFLQFNFAKIKETLKSPDHKRISRQCKTDQILYKHFEKVWILPNISAPLLKNYIVVIVGEKDNLKYIKTIYTADRLKK
jgi:hypothetical protein